MLLGGQMDNSPPGHAVQEVQRLPVSRGCTPLATTRPGWKPKEGVRPRAASCHFQEVGKVFLQCSSRPKGAL